MNWEPIFQLLSAGMLGGLIGFERSLRAKEAGIRTHFLVGLGSALFMIISQKAFEGTSFDSSRVAAQVVSGIGFIGAGVIIFQKNVVRGITTAAGLWVTAAIGLACGAGMYLEGGAATFMALLVLELVHRLLPAHGDDIVRITISSPDKPSLTKAISALKKEGVKIESLEIYFKNYRFCSSIELRIRHKERIDGILHLFGQLDGIDIEEIG